MSITVHNDEKRDRVPDRDPNVTIFLRPIATPLALGLASYAGSTWIIGSYLAGWWGNEESPTIFFPFVAVWGGLGQFIAGFLGYHARDILITVFHVLWGAFYISFGLLFAFVVSIPRSIACPCRHQGVQVTDNIPTRPLEPFRPIRSGYIFPRLQRGLSCWLSSPGPL